MPISIVSFPFHSFPFISCTFSSLLINCEDNCIDSVGISGGKVVVVNPTVNLEKFIEPHLTLDVEKVIEPQPSNQFDNEPLSKWIDEMHMSSVIDGSGKLTCLLVRFLAFSF